MSTNTTVWVIPKPAATDLVRDGDNAMRALVDRIDYLLGEAGEVVFGAVSGSQTTTVALQRAYPQGFYVITSFRNLPAAGAGSCSGAQLSTNGGAGGVAQANISVNRSTAAASTIAYHIIPKPV